MGGRQRKQVPTSSVPLPRRHRIGGHGLMPISERLRRRETMPLSPKDLLLWRTVVPQMSRWLPPEERDQVCAAFDAELERLAEPRAA